MTVAIATITGAACYVAGLPHGRLYAAVYALVGAAAVPLAFFR